MINQTESKMSIDKIIDKKKRKEKLSHRFCFNVIRSTNRTEFLFYYEITRD